MSIYYNTNFQLYLAPNIYIRYVIKHFIIINEKNLWSMFRRLKAVKLDYDLRLQVMSRYKYLSMIFFSVALTCFHITKWSRWTLTFFLLLQSTELCFWSDLIDVVIKSTTNSINIEKKCRTYLTWTCYLQYNCLSSQKQYSSGMHCGMTKDATPKHVVKVPQFRRQGESAMI